jgi:hypothetical protein
VRGAVMNRQRNMTGMFPDVANWTQIVLKM